VEKLRVGIIGAGWMGVVHATAWQTNATRADVVAVADVSPARARDVADRFTAGRAGTFSTPADLLANPDVEAVDICLPHHLHAETIRLAARAGKAILCEKPLCTSLDEAAEIARVLHETGVPFMCAHNQLFQPSLIEAQRVLAAGTLGDVFLVRSIEASQNRMFRTGRLPVEIAAGESSHTWRADLKRMGGGEVLDTGYHAAYRLLALAGERPVEVMAMTGHYFVQEIDAEDTGLVLVRFASGTLGEIVTSWAFGLPGDWQFEIGAARGSLAGSPTRFARRLDDDPGVIEVTSDEVHTYTSEVTHFLDVLQRGESNRASFEHAARAFQLIQAVYLSAHARTAVTLPEDATAPLQT
jgi:predicted dehydrogenase